MKIKCPKCFFNTTLLKQPVPGDEIKCGACFYRWLSRGPRNKGVSRPPPVGKLCDCGATATTWEANAPVCGRCKRLDGEHFKHMVLGRKSTWSEKFEMA